MTNFSPPFRVCKKSKLAILDSKGLEVVIFKPGSEWYAEQFCNYINQKLCSHSKQQND